LQPTEETGRKEKLPSDSSYLNRLLVLLVGLMFIVFYIETMITPSLPSIRTEFGVSIAQASLVIAFYAMSGTALVPVIGKLGDLFGKKRVLVYVLLIYAVSVSITSFSPNFTFLLATRTVQGIGISIAPLIFSLVREEFPRDRLPKAVGLLSGMSGAGLAVALPLGSLISNNFGWQGTYHTAIPFVVVLAVLTYLHVRESVYKRPNVKIDYVGASLLAAALAIIILTLAQGATWGWSSATTIFSAITGAGLLLPLVLYERRYLAKGGEPILNLRLLALRNVVVTNLAIFGLLGFTLAEQVFVYKFELPSPVGFGLDIFQTGLSIVPFAVASFVFAPIAGQFVPKTGVKPLAIFGSLLSGLAFLLVAQATSYSELLIGMFAVGAGISIMTSTVQNLLLLTVDPADTGLANSLAYVFGNLGDCIGAPVAASILSTFTISVLVVHSQTVGPLYQSFPSQAAFQYCFYVAAIVFIAIAILIAFAKEVLGKRASVNSSGEEAKNAQVSGT
jgi:MFS family permease